MLNFLNIHCARRDVVPSLQLILVHPGLWGPTCQSSQQGQLRKWRHTISQESSQLRRIYVLDTENLCSILISEEMGPGEACVVSHLSWVAVPRHQYLFTALHALAFDVKTLHFAISHKPNSKIFRRIPCSWFLFKMVMIILFCNINGSTFGWSGSVGWRGICNSYSPAWLH